MLAQVVEPDTCISSRNYLQTKGGFTVGLCWTPCINSIRQFLPWEFGSSWDREEIPRIFWGTQMFFTAFTCSCYKAECVQATISILCFKNLQTPVPITQVWIILQRSSIILHFIRSETHSAIYYFFVSRYSRILCNCYRCREVRWLSLSHTGRRHDYC